MRRLNFIIVIFLLFLVKVDYSDSSIIANISKTDDLSIDYLIITTDELKSALEPFKLWKQQKGLHTRIITVSEIENEYSGENNYVILNQKIKSCIEDYYINHELKWVLLAGDSQSIPTNNVYFEDNYEWDGNYVICDQYYTEFEGEWVYQSQNGYFIHTTPYEWNNEVFIGRIPFNNSLEMSEYVNNTMKYEKNPEVGNWMKSALLTGAFLYFDEDYNNDSISDWDEIDSNRYNNWLKQNYIPNDWSSTLLGESEGLRASDYYYDESLNERTVKTTIENGINLGIICGHGSTVAIGGVVFIIDYDNDTLCDMNGTYIYLNGTIDRTVQYIDILFYNRYLGSGNLPLTDKRGFYMLLACNTGNFDEDTYYDERSLATSLLKNCSIGVIAGSQASWGEDFWYERDHPGWYNEGIFGRTLEQLLVNGENQPGKAFTLAKQKYTSDMKSLNRTGDPLVLVEEFEKKSLAQFNLLGDPEINLWTEIPEQLVINNTEQIIVTSNDQPLSEVIVTAMNESYYWKGKTDSEGKLDKIFTVKELASLNFTATKNNYLPSFIYTYNEPSADVPSFQIFLVYPAIIVIIFVSKIKKKKI